MLLNLQVYCIPVDLVKYYKNTALEVFFVSFYFNTSVSLISSFLNRSFATQFYLEEKKVMLELKLFQSFFKLMRKCFQLKSVFD